MGEILLGFSTFYGVNNAMMTVVPILVVAGFVLVFGLIIGRLVRSARQSAKNNASPILNVEATLVAKRADVRGYNNAGVNGAAAVGSTFTRYFATFEVASGDRMEFSVNAEEYGMLAERDAGQLTFQGTRYIGFERNR